MTGALTAQAVADLVGGRLLGEGALELRRVRSLDRAGPDDLSVCAGNRWLPALENTRAGAVLLGPDLANSAGPATRIIVDDPMQAIRKVAMALAGEDDIVPGVDSTARIGAGAALGSDVRIEADALIGENVVIGDRSVIGAQVIIEAGVRIGNDTRIDPGTIIHRGAVIGDRVYIKSRAVIGGPGFGFVSSASGHERIPQLGGCILEDDVEIGSNSTVDRGSLDDTVIGTGTKIDNMVHIGHNVRLGKHCLVMAGVGVSGSCRIGDWVVLAGQAGLAGHLEVGDRARIGAQAGVISSIPAGAAVSGYPARPHREFLRAQAALYRLAAHVDTLEALARGEEDA